MATAAATPVEDASARPTSMGMFMPSTIPELRGRKNPPGYVSEKVQNLGMSKPM